MKKDEKIIDELRPEYRREDFGAMVRGKYTERMKQKCNIIVLDSDIAEAFPNSQVVNEILRRLLELGIDSPQAVSPY